MCRSNLNGMLAPQYAIVALVARFASFPIWAHLNMPWPKNGANFFRLFVHVHHIWTLSLTIYFLFHRWPADKCTGLNFWVKICQSGMHLIHVQSLHTCQLPFVLANALNSLYNFYCVWLSLCDLAYWVSTVNLGAPLCAMQFWWDSILVRLHFLLICWVECFNF